MKYADLKIKYKLALGFGVMLVLMSVLIISGLSGITAISGSLFTISSQDGPLVAGANGMRRSLLSNLRVLEAYKGASRVTAHPDEKALVNLEQQFQVMAERFEVNAKAMLQGGQLDDGTKVIRTENPQIEKLLAQANDAYQREFQDTARQMIDVSRAAVNSKREADAAMNEMERAFNKVISRADQAETLVKEKLQAIPVNELPAGAAARLLTDLVPLVDATMELKVMAQEGRLALEEVAQQIEDDRLAVG